MESRFGSPGQVISDRHSSPNAALKCAHHLLGVAYEGRKYLQKHGSKASPLQEETEAWPFQTNEQRQEAPNSKKGFLLPMNIGYLLGPSAPKGPRGISFRIL